MKLVVTGYIVQEISNHNQTNTIMKTLAYTLFVSIVTLSFTVTDLKSQNYREVIPLDQADFACFLQLDCVVNSQSLVNKGWDIVLDLSVNGTNRELTLEMKGQNIRLFAIYDENGSLVRSLYELDNAIPPQIVSQHLIGGAYEGWSIIGSKKSVRDFSQFKTEWSVQLQYEDTIETIRFSHRDIAALETKTILMANQ